MKRLAFLILALFVCLTACANDGVEEAETTWNFGSEAPYTMPDGRVFQHRLELTGYGNTFVVYTDDDTLTSRKLLEMFSSSSLDVQTRLWENYYIVGLYTAIDG